jgi:hypothetical protein
MMPRTAQHGIEQDTHDAVIGVDGPGRAAREAGQDRAGEVEPSREERVTMVGREERVTMVGREERVAIVGLHGCRVGGSRDR